MCIHISNNEFTNVDKLKKKFNKISKYKNLLFIYFFTVDYDNIFLINFNRANNDYKFNTQRIIYECD